MLISDIYIVDTTKSTNKKIEKLSGGHVNAGAVGGLTYGCEENALFEELYMYVHMYIYIIRKMLSNHYLNLH